ncbi:hypothetical protein GCM10023200_28220 [Actinomycetospora chlora]|uniref:Imm-5-like domain-containing protein n=1 Tax=Actinomycetospora chlora TaxID=663608 RepID=A0ABP9BAB4_9PSEU
MPGPTIELSLDEIRAVTAYAVACARPALALADADERPRAAIAAAQAFADGEPRTRALRNAAWAAHRAAREARDAGEPAASEAARATGPAPGAAFLHPLAQATQVDHVLGAAAHAALALAPDDHLAQCAALATPDVVDVLCRYPPAPPGRGRAGELVRALDAALRR